MGFGNDVVNVAVSAPNTRVSSLTTVTLPTFINFTGVLNTSFSGGNNSNPAVTAGTTLATLDPTALAQADRDADGFHRRRVVAGAGPAQWRAARRRTVR